MEQGMICLLLAVGTKNCVVRVASSGRSYNIHTKFRSDRQTGSKVESRGTARARARTHTHSMVISQPYFFP
jgi:hypothetical protein